MTYTSWKVDGVRFTSQAEAYQAARQWALNENAVKYVHHHGPWVSTWIDEVKP